ncbi:hypothetical protein FBU59_007298 [Linderina macrospora]|uniref:Uncharacterized protein n=1 Tax=Linderina macrospora TaxID=4868 RepID=A0ACC1IXI7_9FUNG|nr:hypothetical protein FBU59_007298 [Linderina macrospora]
MPRLDGDSRVMVGRPVHKKLPIGDVESQAETILEMSQGDADDRTLFVLVTDPSTEGESLQGAVRAANRLILDQRTHARRILLVDQPSSGHTVSSSNDLAKSLISDPSVDMRVYDSIGFLAKMQREHYKYGLRYPNHPCIYSETKRCKKPERFFWCDSSRVGSKAHFFMADDILRNHFVSAIVLPLY